MGCWAMVGDYNEDSSIEENLNLLLHLARVETSANSRNVEEVAGTWGSSSSVVGAGGFHSVSQQQQLLERVSRVSKERTLKSSVKT